MQPEKLSSDLRILYVALRRQACLAEPMAPVTCKRLALALARMARKADELETQAADAAALDDELHAVAQDLVRVAGDERQPSFHTALKAQQRVLQAQLDGAGPVKVSRPGAGLSQLSAPIGDSNVVTFPVIPRLRAAFDDGGDAA
ncbi:hypothetical protein BH10PSE8_BH10PSE8_00750 [soil metagenome]